MIFLFNWVMLMFHVNFRGGNLANLQGMGQEMVAHSKGTTKIMRDVYGESYQWSVNSISAHYLWSTEKVRGFWDPQPTSQVSFNLWFHLVVWNSLVVQGPGGSSRISSQPAYHHGNWRGHPPPQRYPPHEISPHYRSTNHH